MPGNLPPGVTQRMIDEAFGYDEYEDLEEEPEEEEMTVHSGKPLRRITLNLYEEDCTWAENVLGYGWTETVREQWSQWCRDKRHQRMEKADE